MRYYGGLFFISAAVLLAATKSPDIFTVAAVAACALMAALSSTRHAVWSAIGGALLIGASLALQSALSYRCTDCIKADLLIMAGVIYLAVTESGGMKKSLRVMAAVATAMLAASALLHYPVSTGFSQEEARGGRISQFISVANDGEGALLDTAVRPALFFSPSCGACRSVLEKLAAADPEGNGWAPVLTGGSPGEGRDLLDSNGYLGVMSWSEWDAAVPALIITRDGQTRALYGQEEILRAVRGDSS
ncbi:MAG: hypothetical protein JL50_21595 [Peptococcaceae bacterium BICA1-7]|nr:MAG: hypothetical protein JL50_21595 [Peptococcaceae bacterium BICA1-7]HBV99332.1 hypothetical protein [Desulfotomaculum sp.]